MAEMKILLAVPTGESMRNADFLDYYFKLETPHNTLRCMAHGQSPAHNRNQMINQAIEANCTHIMLLDDDMAPEPDLIKRLSSHNKDIVSALYLSRNFPHLPNIFDEAYVDGKNKFMFLDPSKDGLMEITNCGLGACLINLNVFKVLEKPYVRLGEIEKDEWCDDIGFFNRVRAAGFKLYCDLDARVGHSHRLTLVPEKKADGNWYTIFRSVNGNVAFRQQVPDDEEIDRQIKELVKV